MIYIIARSTVVRHWIADTAKIEHARNARYLNDTDFAAMKAGDQVFGTLPVDDIAKIIAKGCDYYHANVPESHKGNPRITVAYLNEIGCTLQQYQAFAVSKGD